MKWHMRFDLADGAPPRVFTVSIERDEDGWYVATVAGLRGCHTQARSLPELRERVIEVVMPCLADEEESIPAA